MAKINVTESRGVLSWYTNASAQALVMPPTTAPYDLAVGGTSIQSSPFNVDTTIIRVQADVICAILIGPDPTALSTSTRFVAGQTEDFGVKAGDKIAVITTT